MRDEIPAVDTPLPNENKLLQAGPWRMWWQPENLFVRYLTLESKEWVRGIYFAVRDKHWRTLAAELSNIEFRESHNGFELAVRSRWSSKDIDISGTLRITGRATGDLTFVFDGKAEADSLCNRVGFLLLHPHQSAGQNLEVIHSDGGTEQSAFPSAISPHQPFFDISGFRHQVREGSKINILFDGDRFEMEDQRNWTDASFKTYSRPLALPFPFRLEKGKFIHQSVTVTLDKEKPTKQYAKRNSNTVRLSSLDTQFSPRPSLGIHWPPGLKKVYNPRELDCLKSSPIQHLRVDLPLDFDPTELDQVLKAALACATEAELDIELALYLASDTPVDRLDVVDSLLHEVRDRVSKLLLVPYREESDGSFDSNIQTYMESLRRRGWSQQIGGGTDGFFTDLNRNRPDFLGDFVFFSSNPQVHAFDDFSVAETLDIQNLVVENASRFCRNTPVTVSPISWRIRKPISAKLRTWGGVVDDDRDRSPFGAAWFLSSYLNLASAGANAVTYSIFDCVINENNNSDSPISQIFKLLDTKEDFSVGILHTTAPLWVKAWKLKCEHSEYVCLVNLRSVECTLEIHGFGPTRIGPFQARKIKLTT